jgi:phosphatidylglycerophosphate synthase
MPREGLTKSIVQTLAVYFILQNLAFLVFFRLWLFPFAFVPAFAAAQLVFYLGTLFFLLANRRLFYRLPGGEPEGAVNGANKITLFRITMLPMLVFLTLVSQRPRAAGDVTAEGPLLTAVFALTFASDFFDGRLARKRNEVTYIGRLLDSACDYLLLGVSAGAFFYFKLLDAWLFLLIIIRLFLNAMVMLILFLVRRRLVPQTTPLGKTAIAVIMVLLVVEAAGLTGLLRWTRYAEFAAAAVIGVSMIDKLIFLIRGITRDKPISGE